MAEVVYVLCALTSLACALLLLRSWRHSRFRLILWTSACFIAFAVNNAILVVDLAIVQQTDLATLRNLVALTGVSLLLYGLITEGS